MSLIVIIASDVPKIPFCTAGGKAILKEMRHNPNLTTAFSSIPPCTGERTGPHACWAGIVPLRGIPAAVLLSEL